MRRKISLYIDGRLADLKEDNLVLMNYAVSDVQKPTAVKNSYSKQITLPGTRANDRIFGHFCRLDRAVDNTGFNPLVRTPFKIIADTGELLQSGYLKLDRVDRDKVSHSYTITLYGGLGSLMYGLTYDDTGEKLSLADLPFDVADANFHFTINKDSVANAWTNLYNGSGSAIWDIINFAPCYNGLPSTLNCDKARIQGDYTSVVKLSRKYCEWETRDLRAQLQRPVINVKKVIGAIQDKATALGKTLVLDPSFFKNDNPYYNKAWMLLPPLTDYEDSSAGQIGEASLAVTGENTQVLDEIPMGDNVRITGPTFSSNSSGIIDFSGFDASFYLKGELAINLNFKDSQGYGFMHKYLCYLDHNSYRIKGTLVAVQAIIIGQGNTTLAWSKPYVFGNWDLNHDDRLDYVLSQMTGDGTYIAAGNDIWPGTGYFYFTFDNVPVAASNSVRIMLNVASSSSEVDMGDSDFPLYDDGDGYGTPPAYDMGTIYVDVVAGRFTLNSPGSVGTGTTITKKMLLSGTGTPADFLLSYCRQFGLQVVETAPDTISILTRNTFYNGSTIDLSKRLDRKAVKVTPLLFIKKWQRLGLTIPQTSKAIDYSKQYGKEFGNINLDTGLEFNAEKEELLANSVFKGGISGKWLSRLLYTFTHSGDFVNPALLGGYEKAGTMYYPTYNASTPLNADNPGYDFQDRVFGFELDKGEQKAVEIDGTLVFFNGVKSNPGMWFLSNNHPGNSDNKDVCWQLVTYSDTYSTKVTYLPEFSRYVKDANGNVLRSMDFSTPEEIFDPALTISPASSIYTRFWENFVKDRYDKSNKVLNAKVDLSGLQVGPGLLRNFYYYEGSLWILNKITNYSLTTYDPVECEFLQVRDKVDYTNGQTID